MISQCPHCEQSLKFSPPQMAKFEQALARLSENRSLKFGCPKCKVPIELNREGQLTEKRQAPDFTPAQSIVHPPAAPDIGWLSTGTDDEAEILDDVPTAMILIKDKEIQNRVAGELEKKEFQIHRPGSVDEAVDSLRFREYAVVVYSADYEQGPLEIHDFHKFMSGMSMNKRRKIFYILLGNQVQTLYDLEALTLSCNLLVNLTELNFFGKVFKKGIQSYENLFASYMAMLKEHGKS